MLSVRLATLDDCDGLVGLESALFVEDAGVHEEFADLTWPEREGHADFGRLIESENGIVLVVERELTVIGHLVGYTASPAPTRQPVEYAVLRSLYVTLDHRRSGAALALVDEFLRWALEGVRRGPRRQLRRELGCSGVVRAHWVRHSEHLTCAPTLTLAGRKDPGAQVRVGSDLIGDGISGRRRSGGS